MTDLSFWLNLDQADPSLRRCRERGTPVPADPMYQAAGTKLACALYLLDRIGFYQDASGAAGYMPLVVISTPGDTGPTTLALATTFAIAYDEIDTELPVGWTFDLNLNTDEMLEFIGTSGDSKQATLDISLVTPAGALKLLHREAISILATAFDPSGSTPVPTPGFASAPILRPDITTAALHRAVVTVGRTMPTVFLTLEDGQWCCWTYRVRVGGEVDDGTSYRVANDWAANTNNGIWVKSFIA